ncbi:MAG: hypothetical protein AAFU79_31130, partial [Myxococcota bacterium]
MYLHGAKPRFADGLPDAALNHFGGWAARVSRSHIDAKHAVLFESNLADHPQVPAGEGRNLWVRHFLGRYPSSFEP